MPQHEKSQLTRMLIMRLSAMGDVAMIVPVIHCLAVQYPHLRITVLTRERFIPMFEWMPANVAVKGIDPEKYSGIPGMTRLYNELAKGQFTEIADLHDVLRTKFLRTCFRMSGKKVAVIDKGRKERHNIIGAAEKIGPLKHMTERYADVFHKLGYKINLNEFSKLFNPLDENIHAIRPIVGTKVRNDKWIGIAPFAAHAMKMYPIERMHEVVEKLHEKGYKIFLFGAGDKERDILKSWEHDGVMSVCGKLGGLHNEMLLMSQLDVMVAMDSANMHIAAMIGVKTLSIWGATHPYAGFTGWNQGPENIIQRNDSCRPCSIYGNKPCKLRGQRCMDIPTATIVQKITDILS